MKENPEAWKTGEFWAHVGVDATVGAVNGFVCASGLGVVAQAGLNSITSGLGDVANQVIENKGLYNIDISQSLDVAAKSMLNSVACSYVGKGVNKVSGISDKANAFHDSYLNKTFSANMRREAGRSSSALMRQADRFLNQAIKYDNIAQGTSSVVGSLFSFVGLIA